LDFVADFRRSSKPIFSKFGWAVHKRQFGGLKKKKLGAVKINSEFIGNKKMFVKLCSSKKPKTVD